MLHVKTPEEVLALIEEEFAPVAQTELVSLGASTRFSVGGNRQNQEGKPDNKED